MRYKVDYEKKIEQLLKGKKYKYYIETMGCALNENDSMKYKGLFETMKFEETTSIAEANVILFNTCCIRENAEKKLYGRIGTLKNRKKGDKDLYIAITGCMTEQEHIIEKIKNSYGFVDIVIGTKDMQNFSKKLYHAIIEGAKSINEVSEERELLEDVPIKYEDGYKASVSIIYGCNNFCTYCIVPYVRGREKSRQPEDILNDINELAKKGYKEITLLGQNVNSYGKDFQGSDYTFAKLLREIEKVEKIEIIKFISPHPKDFSDELIKTIARSKKIFKQIHLPLQSGSSKILSAMNRKYTKEQYLELVEKIKRTVKDVSFSTDIIVGFPGETGEDFEETLDVVKKVNYSLIYMFCYSNRKGTVADKMENQVEEKTKVKRLKILKSTFEEMLLAQQEERVGKIESILVEGKSRTNSNKYTGRTIDNKIVIFDASDDDVGKTLKIKIVKNNKWYLTGQKL